MFETISERLARVREAIARAAEGVGRAPGDITLIAVSKTFDAATVQAAVDAGALTLGENRVQEAAEKSRLVRADGLRWHLIGHLQSNKARLAVKTFDCIHTLDRVELVERLDRIVGEERHAAERDRRNPLDVLIQVDLAREATKSGADEEQLPELVAALDHVQATTGNLRLRGLMTLPPFFEEVEQVRPYFQRLREIRDQLNRGRAAERRLTELSMGMSHDFRVAIEEGATMVRVGSAIFGERKTLL